MIVNDNFISKMCGIQQKKTCMTIIIKFKRSLRMDKMKLYFI